MGRGFGHRMGKQASWKPTRTYLLHIRASQRHPGSSDSLCVRGTVPRWATRSDNNRVIPACAGNREAPRFLANSGAGHPRVCRERIDGLRIEAEVEGPPPRMRGTDLVREGPRPGLRVVPACAGNSWWTRCEPTPTTGHPCVCGEQSKRQWTKKSKKGSSLRVRGTGSVAVDMRHEIRVIPACAGNS